MPEVLFLLLFGFVDDHEILYSSIKLFKCF
jgi:hypothetical protein